MPTIMHKRGEATGQAPRAVITTEGVDRDGDIIKADGIDTSKFMRNPVVLFGHNHRDLPVGRATSVQRTGHGIVAEWEWASHAKAREVAEAWREGFIRSVSIGFLPKKRTPRRGGRGVVFEESELLEFSVVPIPANADALAAHLGGKGADVGAALAGLVARTVATELAPHAGADGMVELDEGAVSSAVAGALASALASAEDDVTEVYDPEDGRVYSLA